MMFGFRTNVSIPYSNNDGVRVLVMTCVIVEVKDGVGVGGGVIVAERLPLSVISSEPLSLNDSEAECVAVNSVVGVAVSAALIVNDCGSEID